MKKRQKNMTRVNGQVQTRCNSTTSVKFEGSPAKIENTNKPLIRTRNISKRIDKLCRKSKSSTFRSNWSENRMRMLKDHIYNADCLDVLSTAKGNEVDFIITSPPYADNRKTTYEGVKIDEYVDWFLPISRELYRVLKPNGSFILNIKERVQDGQRGTYVLELILEMKKQGWLWTEEYIWHKKNCYPGKWNNRFRDAWERCLHFTKSKKFKMNQQNVMVPVGEWSKKRLARLSNADKKRDGSKVGSGFSKNISNWIGKELVYPSNVLHMATECSNRGHSAVYPIALPTWFIKLFTDINDVVLDPFMGSGTTATACRNLNRHYVGMEMNKKYHKLAVLENKLVK